MKNKNKNYIKSDQIPDMPEVPSISNIDTLELEDFTNSFPFTEMLDTELEVLLDVPSFSGLDTLDIETASRLIEDLEDVAAKKEILPSIPAFSSEEEQEEPSQEEIELPFDLPAFSGEDADQDTLPAIPSFLDEEEDAPAQESEKLPEISEFFSFNQEKPMPVSEVPECPDQEFKGDLSDAAQDILPLIPSVLDLNEMDLLSMPGHEHEDFQLFEDDEYLPEIPSVADWEEQDEDEDIPEFDEETEELLEPVTEEMLAEEEIIYIDEMPLSVKAKNGLLRMHIRNSRQLVMTDEVQIRNIPYMDEKTFQEIRRYQHLKENPVYPDVKTISKEIRVYLDEFIDELKELKIPASKQRALRLYLCAATPEKNRTKANCFLNWYKETHVQQLLDRYITSLICNRQMSGLSEDMLREDMPVSMDKKILSEILQEMIRSDRIDHTRGNYYILKYPTVIEFLIENTEEKEQHIEVIRMRMQGCTLSEIAKKTGYSKDHVSRIQNKLLRMVQKLCLINSTSVYEERFRPLFERYNLSREVFTALTKEPAEVYQYLSMVSIPGSTKPEEMKYDFGVPDWIRAAWKSYQENS